MNKNPYCPDCDVEMDGVDGVSDSYDHRGEHTQIEWTDYQCPKCKEIFDGAMFIDDGSDDYDEDDER